MTRNFGLKIEIEIRKKISSEFRFSFDIMHYNFHFTSLPVRETIGQVWSENRTKQPAPPSGTRERLHSAFTNHNHKRINESTLLCRALFVPLQSGRRSLSERSAAANLAYRFVHSCIIACHYICLT